MGGKEGEEATNVSATMLNYEVSFCSVWKFEFLSTKDSVSFTRGGGCGFVTG